MNESFDTPFSWASVILPHLPCLHIAQSLSLAQKEKELNSYNCAITMNEDESNKKKLKDDYNSGLITFDQYTEGLVQLLVGSLTVV